MYMVALSILKNTGDAEDIVQEALLVAYEKLYTLKNDDKFKSWMMRIVVNQAKMHIRKNTNIVYVDNMEDVVEKYKEDKSKNEDIWEIVLSLKNELSTVVILYYAQGYSISEISKLSGILYLLLINLSFNNSSIDLFIIIPPISFLIMFLLLIVSI